MGLAIVIHYFRVLNVLLMQLLHFEEPNVKDLRQGMSCCSRGLPLLETGSQLVSLSLLPMSEAPETNTILTTTASVFI